MKRVLLIMTRTPLAQGLMLRAGPGLSLTAETDYSKAAEQVRDQNPQAVLLEVTENEARDMDYCLGLCDLLRAEHPDLACMLLCPEQKPEAVQKAVLAKQQHRIDDFAFYEVSMDYLLTSLEAL